jgi:hypothetical protein
MIHFDDFPRNELEFHERFSSEEACREYWSSVRWPDGFVCPHCGHKGGWRRREREEWVCASKTCGKETSPRAGTVLHKSRKPLRAWLLAMLHMSVNKQGISALRLQRLMGFGSYETALRWLRELRRVMASQEESEKLGPEVEVDEAFLGGVEKGRGRGSWSKTMVVGAVEKRRGGCGRARLRLVTTRLGSELCGFVQDVVAAGSLVVTDGLQGYVPLVELGYRHDPRTTTDGKGRQLKTADGQRKAAVHLPRIHKVFSLVERIVLGCLQGSFDERHLQFYLDEYCFRFNRRNTQVPLGIFQTLVARAAGSQCVPLWRSSGREAPDRPTRKVNAEWQGLAVALRGCGYVG